MPNQKKMSKISMIHATKAERSRVMKIIWSCGSSPLSAIWDQRTMPAETGII